MMLTCIVEWSILWMLKNVYQYALEMKSVVNIYVELKGNCNAEEFEQVEVGNDVGGVKDVGVGNDVGGGDDVEVGREVGGDGDVKVGTDGGVEPVVACDEVGGDEHVEVVDDVGAEDSDFQAYGLSFDDIGYWVG